MKNLLSIESLSRDEILAVLADTAAMKSSRGHHASHPLRHQCWALIFSKSSTRTRVSFEVGIRELGGDPMFLAAADIQLGRGESIEDTAKVLSRFVHGLIVRTFDHSEVERLAAAGNIPVINALTDFLHPCQIYTDAFTMMERWAKGTTGAKLVESLRGRKIAFLGDTACNMANSWILGANLFGMKIVNNLIYQTVGKGRMYAMPRIGTEPMPHVMEPFSEKIHMQKYAMLWLR